ncbi:unknown [Eggerthella sp. CAG:1427]|nr:unknown [Eggerthella sp. CAG:1427]
MQVEEQDRLQDDEQRRSRHEIPFPCLVAEQSHRDHAAHRSAQQRKPHEPQLRQAQPAFPPRVDAIVGRDELVEAERQERGHVRHQQVDAQSMQDTAVESMENGIPKTVERDEAPFPRAHHAPHDQAHDGREPPGDVALVHAPGPYGQREEHSGSATGDGEERQDPPVHQTGVPIVVIARHDQIVDGEQQERDHVDGDQIYKERIHHSTAIWSMRQSGTRVIPPARPYPCR